MQKLNIDYKLYKNSDILKLCNILRPLTNRAYLVGGGVRDFLLGLEVSDFDVEIYDIEPDKFINLMENIGAIGVGKSFFIYKWGKFDLAMPRTESKTGFGHRGFSVEYCNDEKLASKRRDFTINALMMNIFNGEILDFWGGLSDLKGKILRIVSKDSFADDSLRVLRALQFVSRFNLKIDKNSFEIMKKIDISDLSKDRIRVEFEKLFGGKFSFLCIELMSKFGFDEKFFGIKFKQDDIANLVKNIKKHQHFIKSNKLFLYEILGYFKLDYSLVEQNFGLDKSYKFLKNESYFYKISKLEMLKIGLRMPLKNWLGLNSNKRVELAKKLQIYENKLELCIDREKIAKNCSDKTKVKDCIKDTENCLINQILKELKA